MGKKTLLVELGEKSSITHLAGIGLEGNYEPQKTGLGFDWSLLRGVDCLTDYVGSIVKVEKLAKMFFNNPFMKTLLDVAPGLDDLAIMGKLTSDIRHHGPGFHYDHVVIDGHSTGSFLSMLQAPQLLAQMVSSGPLHTQSLQIAKTLKDPTLVETLFVTLLEDLPVDELLESTKDYESLFGKNYSVIMNKSIPSIQTNDTDGAWSKFINEKMQIQKRLEDRVKANYQYVCYQKLITEDVARFLKNSKPGELLPC